MPGGSTVRLLFVKDGELNLVVDALALLGGNEYLVQQMINKMEDTNYRFIFQGFFSFAVDFLSQLCGGSIYQVSHRKPLGTKDKY